MATEAQSPQPTPDHDGQDHVNNDAGASSAQQQSGEDEPRQPSEPAAAEASTSSIAAGSTPTTTTPAAETPAAPAPAAATTTTTTTPLSPPLPSRPTAVTPGPRAQRLQEMFDAALRHTLAKISPDNFASCYPTVALRAPHVLRQVQRGMVDRLGQLCGQEFASVLARYSVVARLNELETLVSDAELRRRGDAHARARSSTRAQQKQREGESEEQRGGADGSDKDKRPPVPPHLLPAGAVLAAHLAPHLAAQQSQLNARLQNTQAANVALWDEVQAQRAEVEALLGALEATLADVDGAAALLDDVPAEELARESRAVEAEMVDV